ncbi:HD family phosphohydrolase [Heyndrickxia oleronia]|uniref:HD family phosphohydrolase n=1 Tax=Heyndrickxia oleronia TaxID=38875 RepID=UPI001B1216CD|nr:HD family phosphohydrolase [Heyndrickxia oleronia]GIN38542.1 cyclic-di-AMP phosphodiesterase PgpH [Heyndrickxia oleronia]
MNLQDYISKVRTLLSYKVFTFICFLILAILLYGVLFYNVKPQTYDIELFSVADKTIRSPKTIVDEEKTKDEQQKAADAVEKVYTFQKEKEQNRVSLINSIFDFVTDANKEIPAHIKDKEMEKTDKKTDKERLVDLKSKLTSDVNEDVTKSISDVVLMDLLKATPFELEQTRNILNSQVEQLMGEKIREDKVRQYQGRIEDLIRDSSIPTELKSAAIALGKYAIVPNDIYDPEQTDIRKKQAMQSVEPIKILQGQVIVQEGHLIDHESYHQLELLGLLKSNPTIKPYIGLGIFVFLIIGSLYLYFSTFRVSEEKKQNYLILLSLIFIISLLLMKIIGLMADLELDKIGYLFPAAMAPMLIRMMLNERFAFIITIILAACGSIIFHDEITGSVNIEIAIYILFSGTAGILLLTNRNRKSNILQAGFFISIINILIIFFLLFLGNGQFTKMEYLYYTIFAFVSGLLSAILTIGLLPFFEAGFGVLSTLKLIELSSPNHPLLKKILTEAPGTYHHSVMVANLAEAACEAIGANGLLARVGCYYHDIGKTRRPQFFIENQMNIENPHNHISPETSKDIIIAHATDGAQMLKKHKLPKEIVDIAEQHHGTTLLKYFYYKAKEENDPIDEMDYRYPGPKPQTKEAAIISIADSVEAAVRSMTHPTPEQIKNLIDSIVQERLKDGQLNECDITLKEIEVIKKTFCETLNGIFHSRIEYPNPK